MKQPRTVLAMSAVFFSFGAQAEMKEMPGGLWEMKFKMDMPGMPPEMAAKMDMVMNSPRGSMKMQTEGKRIADTCEKK